MDEDLKANDYNLTTLEQRIEALEYAAAEKRRQYAIPDAESQSHKANSSHNHAREAMAGFADGLTGSFALTTGLST